MTVNKGDDLHYRVTPPTFRVDISREIDLIEEIARLHGYDRIPVTRPAISIMSMGQDRRKILEERITHAVERLRLFRGDHLQFYSGNSG